MASKKDLKKNVNYAIGELFTECWVQYNYVSGTNKEAAQKVMVQILELQDEFIKRICHPEPGNIKGYYRKLRSDFNAQVSTIIEGIGKLN